MYIKLRIFSLLYPIFLLVYFAYSDLTFTNDKIDRVFLLLACFSFPFSYLPMFRKVVSNIVVYILSIFFIFLFLNLLSERVSYKLGFNGRIVVAKNGMTVKEGTWGGFLDSGFVFYAFQQSERFPFMEKMNRNPAKTMNYYFDHKVEILNSGEISILYLDQNKIWQSDTLSFNGRIAK